MNFYSHPCPFPTKAGTPGNVWEPLGTGQATQSGTDESRAMSAPTIYNPAAVWPVIFEAISNGASLTEAMRQPNMPSLAWAKRQLQHDPDLQRAYQAAIVERAQALADQIVQLSDSQPPPGLEGAALSAWVQQLKLRLWARTWVAAKLAPRQWGERLDVSVTETRISITAALKAAESRLIDLPPEPRARDNRPTFSSTANQELSNGN
jgi:hypothetical protein